MKNTYQTSDISFEQDENGKLNVRIDTESLYLESVEEKDANAYHSELYSQKEVMEKFATGETRDLDFVKDRTNTWVERWKKNDPFSSLAVTKNDDDSFVGQVVLGYGDNAGESELAYLFAKKYWGKGLGKEAVSSVVLDYAPKLVEKNYEVNEGKFTSIVATARKDNPASVKILEKVGMEKIGENEKFGHLRNLYKKEVKGYSRG